MGFGTGLGSGFGGIVWMLGCVLLVVGLVVLVVWAVSRATTHDHETNGPGRSDALEILEDGPVPDIVIVPVGGGGLVSGVAAALKARRPDVRVIGVEPERSTALHDGLAAGRSVPVTPASKADALSAPFAGENCVQICAALGVESVLVSDDDLCDAFRWLYARMKLACELGAAASTAALLSGKIVVEPGQNIVAVVSGGNVAPQQAAAILASR